MCIRDRYIPFCLKGCLNIPFKLLSRQSPRLCFCRQLAHGTDGGVDLRFGIEIREAEAHRALFYLSLIHISWRQQEAFILPSFVVRHQCCARHSLHRRLSLGRVVRRRRNRHFTGHQRGSVPDAAVKKNGQIPPCLLYTSD